MNYVDPTGHVAWSLTGGLNFAIGIGFRLDVGLAVDEHGNFGIVGDIGFVKGLAIGVGVEGSAYDVDGAGDLRGYSKAAGYSYVAAGGEGFWDADGNYIGGGVNVGKGLAYAAYTADIQTGVIEIPIGDWVRKLLPEEPEPTPPASLREYYEQQTGSKASEYWDDDTLRSLLNSDGISIPSQFDF